MLEEPARRLDGLVPDALLSGRFLGLALLLLGAGGFLGRRSHHLRDAVDPILLLLPFLVVVVIVFLIGFDLVLLLVVLLFFLLRHVVAVLLIRDGLGLSHGLGLGLGGGGLLLDGLGLHRDGLLFLLYLLHGLGRRLARGLLGGDVRLLLESGLLGGWGHVLGLIWLGRGRGLGAAAAEEGRDAALTSAHRRGAQSFWFLIDPRGDAWRAFDAPTGPFRAPLRS